MLLDLGENPGTGRALRTTLVAVASSAGALAISILPAPARGLGPAEFWLPPAFLLSMSAIVAVGLRRRARSDAGGHRG